jgi:tetratricopeptide (TPR) repeat protein
MESRRRALGPQHPDTLSTMASLGEMWDEQSRYAEAEPLLREALAAYQKAPEGRDRYAIESELGWNLAAQRKFAEAETRLLAGYQGLKKDDPGTAKAGTRIVQLYLDWGKLQKAEEWQTKLHSLKQTGQR